MTSAQLTGPVLSVRAVHLWRGASHVLRGLSFDASAGEVWVLEGPNGSGKTSLLRVIAGLLWPEEGNVQWHGRALRAPLDATSVSVSYLAHDAALHDDLTPLENLRDATQLQRVCSSEEAAAMLMRVGVQAADRATRSLSAGQRRRVALARVLLSQAPVWLLDEPWTHLDASGVTLFQELITDQVRRGGLVILSTHQDVDLPSSALRRLTLS
jgi:heme exporter protein A